MRKGEVGKEEGRSLDEKRERSKKIIMRSQLS